MPVIMKKFSFNEINVLVLDNTISSEFGVAQWQAITDKYNGVGGDIVLVKTPAGFECVNVGKKLLTAATKHAIISHYYEMINSANKFIEIRLTDKFVSSIKSMAHKQYIA